VSSPGRASARTRNRAGVGVESVLRDSPADSAGIRAGDRIVSVSGAVVEDLLDLHFLTSRRRYTLRWRSVAGAENERPFRLPAGTFLGVFPEPIRVRRCRNRCIFCFVHQLPKGLRRALYVKDEDVRLSFLHGQYVTFSDLTDDEMRKIVRYRLSPLYVSIHTTDPELRRRMLGNPAARDVRTVLRALTNKGVELHGQIVVCPGINDGDELERTLRDLSAYRPGLRSVAVVPVGLTAHRAGLPPLRPVAPAEARQTLALLRRLDRADRAAPFAVAADEYHLLAGAPIPGRKAYGEFAQIGNGVGLVRRFLDESATLFRRKRWPAGAGEGTVATGRSAAQFVKEFLEAFARRAGTRFHALPVTNRLMGESVTVTGLLPGEDIVAAAADNPRGTLYIPDVALRDAGDIFLDGVSPDEIASRLGREVRLFEATPRGFFDAVYAENRSEGPISR
jgi:putative radical SAM enzyme (TIGR03279 family)